jgi:hypothetical protein
MVAMTSLLRHPIRRRSWLPSRRLARRSRGPLLGGLWLRVLTKWKAPELDRQLANGIDPMLSDELSLRVGQLGSLGTRVLLANTLRRAVQLARGQRRPLIPTRLRRAEIQENDELLLALAERLHDGEPVGVQGLARTARLVSHRSGAVYRSVRSGSLATEASKALAALERGHRTAGNRAQSRADARRDVRS